MVHGRSVEMGIVLGFGKLSLVDVFPFDIHGEYAGVAAFTPGSCSPDDMRSPARRVSGSAWYCRHYSARGTVYCPGPDDTLRFTFELPVPDKSWNPGRSHR